MKAEELLSRYRQGERNFAGANLRGQSFKGQVLSEVDFSRVDIRGTNFSDATLVRATFHEAKAGLQKRWVVISAFLAWLFSVCASFLLAFSGYVITQIFEAGNLSNNTLGWVTLVVQFVCYILILRKGISIVFARVITFGFAVTFIFGIVLALAFPTIGTNQGVAVIAGVFAGVGAGSYAVFLAGVFAGAWAVAQVIGAGIALVIAVIISILGAGAGAINSETGTIAARVSVGISIACVLASAYIGWQSLKGDLKYTLIKSAAIAFATWGGTSFRGADLTNADFNQACLDSTDFREATITRTSWLHTRLLERIRPGDSFLSNPKICTLVQTGEGKDIDLTHLNLRGINLANAQLENACFRAADLSESSLADANLTRANLVQTQLSQTDLSGATLTGATIEDWGITGNTNLQGVHCEYVYMRWVREGAPDPNPRRKPDNYEETFADGEFSDFIKPIVDTLDLYHNQNVDPHTIAIAFKQFVENNPDAEIQIASIEAKGAGNLLLRTKTASTADHSKLNKEYFETLNYTKTLSPGARMLLAAKEREINRLSTMFNNFMESAMDRINTVNINAGGDISGIINFGEIAGDLNNSIQQLPTSSDSTQPNLKDLLNQLQTAIAEEPELDDTEKAAAFAQVKKLAEAGQAPQDSRMKQLATKATGFSRASLGV
ncbi:pentapeptide repeat-containing protein [Acaryochloris marina]|uniref:Pentapeptide repeat protein n=1 Tax=Acaryochloris marina (strain MBIC 11017) TaxID=329726 RepID=B0C437_ACAM1|nr:pentapeptide repeat-containing protein [Acaryochloris marina]ABW26297.1 pentapeptide repeat protein [Acaryochloris marina MBIC11017]